MEHVANLIGILVIVGAVLAGQRAIAAHKRRRAAEAERAQQMGPPAIHPDDEDHGK